MSNLKQPIEYRFDLNTKSQPKTLCVTHTDDNDVDVIKLIVTQGETVVDLSEATVTARMVMRWTHELLADNVACTLSESCDILIPIDSSAIPVRTGEMLVEVNIKSTVNDETLTLQFPLIVRVNGSILEAAEVTPDSRGTIPELLQEVERELERVEGYVDEAKVFEILDGTLSGNRNISPTLLVDNIADQTYNPNGDLIMYYIDSDWTRHNIFDFTQDLSLRGDRIFPGTIDWYRLDDLAQASIFRDYGRKGYPEPDLMTNPSKLFMNGVCYIDDTTLAGLPVAQAGYWIKIHSAYTPSGTSWTNYIEFYIAESSDRVFLRHIFQGQYTSWQEIGEKGDKGDDGFSPTVSTTSEYLRTRVEITDVNGTHNFFVNDGESVKSAVIDANGDLIITIKGKPTSGVHPTYPERIYNVGHVVGADGYSPTATVTQTSSGATISITDATGTTTANISNGSDYILTAQDKSDIADLVLAALPTTQGVQYGNTGN